MRINFLAALLISAGITAVGCWSTAHAQDETAHAQDETARAQDETDVWTPNTSTVYAIESAAEAKIRETLATKTDFPFHDTLFVEVTQHLSEKLDLPIVVLESAKDAGLTEDEAINVDLYDIEVRSGLNILLAQYDCGFTIQDDVLKIASIDELREAESFTRTMYDVSDLKTESQTELADAITSAIDSDEWEENGGTAKIVPLIVNGRSLLLVNHHEGGHQKIQEFLDGLRMAVEGKPSVVNFEPVESINVYVVPEDVKTDAREIAVLISNTLSDVAWDKSQNHSINSYGNILVAKNNEEALAKVDVLLRRIGVSPKTLGGGGGFGGGGGKGGGVFSIPD